MTERRLSILPLIVVVGSIVSLLSLFLPWVVVDDGYLTGVDVMLDPTGYPTLVPLAVLGVAIYSMSMAAVSVVFREFSRRRRVSVYTILMWVAVMVLMDGFQTTYHVGVASDVASVGALVCIVGSLATGFVAPREITLGRKGDSRGRHF